MPWGEGGECQKKDLGRISWRRAMSKLSIRVRYRIPKGFQLFIMGNLTKSQGRQKLTPGTESS